MKLGLVCAVLVVTLAACGSGSAPSQLPQFIDPLETKLARIRETYVAGSDATLPAMEILESQSGMAPTSAVIDHYRSAAAGVEAATPLFREMEALAASVSKTFEAISAADSPLSDEDVSALSVAARYYSAVALFGDDISASMGALGHLLRAWVAGGEVASLAISNYQNESEIWSRTELDDATMIDLASWRDSTRKLLTTLDAVEAELAALREWVDGEELVSLLAHVDQMRAVHQNKVSLAEALLARNADAYKEATQTARELQRTVESRTFDLWSLHPRLNAVFEMHSLSWNAVEAGTTMVDDLPSEQRDLLAPYLLPLD